MAVVYWLLLSIIVSACASDPSVHASLSTVGRPARASVSRQHACVSSCCAAGDARTSNLGPSADTNCSKAAFTAAMSGRGQAALAAADTAAAHVANDVLTEPALEFVLAQPAIMRARFGRWNEILALSEPAPHFRVARGLWLYARGLAWLASQQVDQAVLDHFELVQLLQTLSPDYPAGKNQAKNVLAIAAWALEGKIEEHKGHHEQAIALVRQAVKQEDALLPDDPPNWWVPSRHMLGALLLSNGKAEDAERVYREDLELYPENGWSLTGLSKALAQQGKKNSALQAAKEASEAFSKSDTSITASTF